MILCLRHALIKASSLISLCVLTAPLMWPAQAENKALHNTKAIQNTQPLRPNSSAIARDHLLENLDVRLCAEYLSLQPNSRYRHQPNADVEYGLSSLLDDVTKIQLQAHPSLSTKKTTKTETTTTGTTKTETITNKTSNSASLVGGKNIDVAFDHRSGLLSINGKISDNFEKRMIQEDCLRALQK